MSGRDSTVFEYIHEYGCDIRERRVFNHYAMESSEEVGEVGIEYVSKNILYLDKTVGPIQLWINNEGGWLHEMWAVIDIITSCKNEVITVAYGNVSSAACLLLASGTGTRYAMPHASFMWHAGTTDVDSSMHWPDARDRMKREMDERSVWIDAMSRVTAPVDEKGRKIKTLRGRYSFWDDHADGGGELWMDSKQMVRNGVVDEIWTR